MKNNAASNSRGMDESSSIQERLLDVLHSLLQEAMRARLECEVEELLAYVKSIAVIKNGFSDFIEDKAVLSFDPELILRPFRFSVNSCARTYSDTEFFDAGKIVTVISDVNDDGEVTIDFAVNASYGRVTGEVSAHLLCPVNVPEFNSCVEIIKFIRNKMSSSGPIIERREDECDDF